MAYFPNTMNSIERSLKVVADVLVALLILVFAIVFFGVLTPIGLIKRAIGWDPLHRRAERSNSYWRPYSKRQLDPRHYEKMF